MRMSLMFAYADGSTVGIAVSQCKGGKLSDLETR